MCINLSTAHSNQKIDDCPPSHFTGEKTEAQRSQISIQSHSESTQQSQSTNQVLCKAKPCPAVTHQFIPVDVTGWRGEGWEERFSPPPAPAHMAMSESIFGCDDPWGRGQGSGCCWHLGVGSGMPLRCKTS